MTKICDFLGRPASPELQPFLKALDCTDPLELAGMYAEARERGHVELMRTINRRMGEVLAALPTK